MTRSALAALLLAVVVPAQAGGQPPANKVEYDKLVAEWTAATKAATEAQKAMLASEAYKTAAEAKDAAKLTELRGAVKRPDAKAFGARFLSFADQFAGDDGLPFLTFASANLFEETTIKAVVDRLLKDHVKSAGIDEILENASSFQRFAGKEQADALLARVIAENPNPVPKAWALYWQASLIQRDKDASAEAKAKAEQQLAEAEKLAAGTLLADRIAAPRFVKERLQIGMEAPEIVGEDLDGASFSLGDYRGKVVVIDFWGFW